MYVYTYSHNGRTSCTDATPALLYIPLWDGFAHRYIAILCIYIIGSAGASRPSP